MEKIKLIRVSRKYVLNKTTEFYAAKNINLSFGDKGLVSICGKSGSGKSTILNMIGLLDSPTEGSILFENKNINNFKKKEKNKYYKSKIAILFQNYNLLDDQTVIFNVALPLLINGIKKNIAYKKAKEILDFVPE